MRKRLEWSKRAEHDVARIVDYYAEAASGLVARRARDAIVEAANRLTVRPVLHRFGKRDTRECVLRKFPYTLIYRATDRQIRIVRVLHQARRYFNG